MFYVFELIHHSNIRYREAVARLGRCELLCMLHALGIETDQISVRTAGRVSFLCFESRTLSPGELTRLAGHSSVGLMAEEKDGWLHPLDVPSPDYLPEDLSEILKYRGKTSVPFTRFMVNTAAALSPYANSAEPLTLLDPLCGKGTSLFCALQAGMNAVGLDQEKRSIQEADAYFSRYMKTLRLKHSRSAASETWKGRPIPVIRFILADTKEHARNHDTRSLCLACGDTSAAPALTRRGPAHVLVADLPYGVQHAPVESGRKPESFQSLLRRSLPLWHGCLAPEGFIALSFNEFTLASQNVISILSENGFTPFRDACFTDLRHEVEQAVSRNVVFAIKNKEDYTL